MTKLCVIVFAVPAIAQQMVCGAAEYEARLKQFPPTAEYLRYPIPPGAKLDIQQSIFEGWPRRSWSETFVYKFLPGAKVADVEKFFLQTGVYNLRGTLYTDVNPNRRPGDAMRKVTEDNGFVTFSIYRSAKISEGTPFGDVAWTSRQLRDNPPTAADLAVPLYPGAVLDIDKSTRGIFSGPSNYFYYLSPDRPEAVKAFYGIPLDGTVRELNRFDTVSAEPDRTGASKNGTLIRVLSSYTHSIRPGQPAQAPTSHLTGAGPAVPGPPPGWKARQWKGGCERGPIAPIVALRQ